MIRKEEKSWTREKLKSVDLFLYIINLTNILRDSNVFKYEISQVEYRGKKYQPGQKTKVNITLNISCAVDNELNDS
jgi:hypothetical protein